MKFKTTASVLSAALLVTSMAFNVMADDTAAENKCEPHNAYKTYCSTCDEYYCLDCYGSVHQTYDTSASDYCNRTSTPTISVDSGDKVSYGSKVYLSCEDSAFIYYTTDGSDPTTSSAIYTSPITATGDMTIKIIAKGGNKAASGIVTSSFEVLPELNFRDLSGNEKLIYSVGILVDNDVIENSTEFDPSDSVTYKDIFRMFTYAGYEINVDDYKDIDEDAALTNAEMAEFFYNYMLSEEMIEESDVNETIIKVRFENNETIDEDDYVAFISLYQNDMLDAANVKADENATNATLAYAVAGMMENIEIVDAEQK